MRVFENPYSKPPFLQCLPIYSCFTFRTPKCNCINMTLFSSEISNEVNYFKRKVVKRPHLSAWRKLGNISRHVCWPGSMFRKRAGPGGAEQCIENDAFNILRTESFSLMYLVLLRFFSKIHGKKKKNPLHCFSVLISQQHSILEHSN